jgi:putative DNA-invertase from lambdoid prophage Rac
MSSLPLRAAIWARVSTDHQTEANQLPELERFCEHHGYEIAKRYLLNDVSAFKGAHRETLNQALDDAYRGEFSVLVVWAVDRITRAGIEDLLKLIRQLRERHCTLVSIQEPWLNGSDATTELLAAIAAWVANQESARRSERIKAGIARRRAEGKPVGGRQPGSKDRRPRSSDGYVQAWERRRSASYPTKDARAISAGMHSTSEPDQRASGKSSGGWGIAWR